MKLEFESNPSTLPFAVNNYPAAVDSENGAAKTAQMLQAGIKAAQSGNRNEARQMLIQVTEAEPQNETAWLWMASISEYPEELIIFLNNVLSINPNNARALEWMTATRSLLAKTFVQRGHEAANDVNKDFARQCFLQAIVHNNRDEAAWLGLAEISDSNEEKISHLHRVLNINPENEAAQTLMAAAKNQLVELTLTKANRAAISGDREEAKELLQEIFKLAPELEEAWILKSYLADSFSEKVTCFEKVLTLNPLNEMALSGLASLRAMMARTESSRTAPLAEAVEQIIEQQAVTAVEPDEIPMPEVLVLTEENIELTEENIGNNNPTEKLEYSPVLMQSAYLGGDSEETPFKAADEISASTETVVEAVEETVEADAYQAAEQVAPQPLFEENFEENAAANDFDSAPPTEENSAAPEAAAEETVLNQTDERAPSFEEEHSAQNPLTFETESSEENHSPETEDQFAPEHSDFVAQTVAVNLVEMANCPFCDAENEASAFVCGSCRTILTLSDLEMLLAHTEADQETLRHAVERMESEVNGRFYDVDKLRKLAIGQINLKNLRRGIVHLQKAAQLNPNDVMLGAQVNFLKIRIAEIEQHESAVNHAVKGRTILVADDSATIRKLIASKLEKSGHQVVCAVDGADALEKIKDVMPDLILLDIMMPQLDGYQVCKIVRSNELTKKVPIVMISGKDGFFDKVRGRMAGTSGYITKPFGPETLMRTVETYIVQKDEPPAEVQEIG